MTLRDIFNWVVDTNIFIVAGVAVVFIVVLFITWLFFSVWWGSKLR